MLTITDIRVAWPQIRDQVAALCTDERPEDLYAACLYGKASLLMCEDGYVICRLQEDNTTGQQQMWIWQASASISGAVEKYQHELDQLCIKSGASVMMMASSRKGWRKTDGWEESHTIYVRKVPQ